MHFEITQEQGLGFSEVALHHKGETLSWNVPTYRKVKLVSPRVFDEINAYWAWRGEAVQDAIWEEYKEIREYLDEMIDAFHMGVFFRKKVNAIYQHMPMETFQHWLLANNPYIPGDVKDTYDSRGRDVRPDLTYLREDYIDLATLALALRPMLVIWGEYIDQGGEVGSGDMYKEMDAMGLISETEMMTWPQDRPAMDKLFHYIRINAEKNPTPLASLWKGMGSAETPHWLLALVVVRRLTIVPLCDHSATHSIIANVFGYITSKLKPTDRRSSDKVKDKNPDRDWGDDDDKTSRIEEYKVKQRIADGDAVLFEEYSRNMAGIAQKVDPTVDLSLLEKSIESLSALEGVEISDHQIRLAQWVLAKGYSPRALYYINKAAVARLLVTTQALLWHWGYLDLACLVTVDRITTNDQNIPGISQSGKSSTRIARKFYDVLLALFKHNKPQREAKTRNGQNPLGGNVAAIGINTLTKDIMGGEWKYVGPRELYRLSEQPGSRGYLVIPATIKTQLTELTIHLAELNR